VAVRIFVAVVRFAITLVDVDAIISVVVELVSSVADALVGPKSIAASSVCWTIEGISIALVDVFTDEPVSHVLESGPAFASERTRVIGAIRLRTARSVLDAFIDVVAVAVHSVASPADIAVTLVAADVIGASSVDIAIVVIEQDCGVALIDIGTRDAIAIVSFVTGAVERAIRVGAGRVVVTVVKVNRINRSALVDVLANKAVTLEPIVTSARVASWVVGASCVIVTNSWDECTLIIVSTETVCSVSRISSVTSTVPAGNFIKTEGV